MDYLIVENFRPYDGRYELDAQRDFTTREWGWFKRLAGYYPTTVEEGYRRYDPELFAVLAVVCLRRAGRIDTHDVPDLYDRLLDREIGVVRVEFHGDETAEDDAEDPTASSTASTKSSGADSNGNSEKSGEPIPPSIGTPASASSESDPQTSVK